MAISQLINSFNAGELSPQVSSRVDLEKYRVGCQELENFMILPSGGVIRRPGTQYMGAAKREDKRARLMGFNFSTTTSFVLEFGEGYVRFWSNEKLVESRHDTEWEANKEYAKGYHVRSSGAYYRCEVEHMSTGSLSAEISAGKWVEDSGVLELVTPYTEADLRGLQYVQINDIVYLTHPNHMPCKLTREADDNWTFDEVRWDWPVFLAENATDTTIAVGDDDYDEWIASHAYVVGDLVMYEGILYRAVKNNSNSTFNASKWEPEPGNVEGEVVALTASDKIFKPEHLGAHWMIGHRREDGYIEMKLDGSEEDDLSPRILDMIGKWELTTYGNWKGTLSVQRSTDKVIERDKKKWETIRTYRSAKENDRNVASTGTEEKQCWLQLKFLGDGGSADPHAVLELGDNRRYGVVKITEVIDETHAQAVVVKDLGGISKTKIWAEGAFSRWQGYPQSVCLHDQRIIYGGTKRHPMSVWGSVTDDFENFRRKTTEDGSFLFTLAGTESNRIQWMAPQGDIAVGTAGNEWTLGGPDDATSLSATNVRAKYQSSFGSSAMQARVVNEVIVFIQRRGRKVRELVFSNDKQGWVAPDLTILAEHISEGGFVETAFQQQPDSIYWAITGNGELVGMTYERDQQVAGWHRHTTGQGWMLAADGVTEVPVSDKFESVATIYGDEGSDEVWFLVKRTVAGEERRYIERLRPNFRQAFHDEDMRAWWYLDCAKEREEYGTPVMSVTTDLAHLEGRRVGLFCDEAPQPETHVEGGVAALQDPARRILVGLPYHSVLRPMPLDAMLQDGTSLGRKGRVHKVFARFLKSLGGEYSANGRDWNAIYSRDFADVMDVPPPVFTGEKEVYMDGGFTRRPEVVFRQAQPLPLCVLALIPRWEAYGD